MSSNLLARWLVLDKPAGCTSHDMVAKARRALGLKRIGHTGTLDPDATGVLVLAVGKATRLIQYLPGGKAYRAQIQLGLQTSTYDISGEVLEQQRVPELSAAQLEKLLAGFLGPQLQVPPMVSAISIGGKRLYELARQGIELERPARPVVFEQIKLLNWHSPFLELDIDCSAGTYIRSLAHDLGQKLGCGACLSSLRRTRAHQFGLEQAISLESLRPLAEQPEQGFAADWALRHFPAVYVDPKTLIALRLGQAFAAQGTPEQMVRVYGADQSLAALGQYTQQGTIQPRLLFLEPIYESLKS